MVNINKVKRLSKEKGIKQGFLCSQLGMTYAYLNDVAKGKSTMSDDRIKKSLMSSAQPTNTSPTKPTTQNRKIKKRPKSHRMQT